MVGILGGLGPLSSAEFVRTIYEAAGDRPEQDMPALLLWSDPSFPDRTPVLLNGGHDLVAARLDAILQRMRGAGAEQLVVCCMTAHAVLERLPRSLSGCILSVLDEAIEALAAGTDRVLMLASSGTRALRLFESHPRWAAVDARCVWPDAAEQQWLHASCIYRIKQNEPVEPLLPSIQALLDRYGAASFAVGCSEVHLLAKAWRREHPERPPVDAFARLAHRIAHQPVVAPRVL